MTTDICIDNKLIICGHLPDLSYILFPFFLQQLFQQGGLFFLNSQHAFKKIGGLFVQFHDFIQRMDSILIVLIIFYYSCIIASAFKIVILNHD